MGEYVFNRSRPGIWEDGLDVEAALNYKGPWPAVTCICPTYGRFRVLRDAIACFILQDYPGERKLLISNDAPVQMHLTGGDSYKLRISPTANIVLRYDKPFPAVGFKKQSLLDAVKTELVGHWEDDDLYLPWHLTHLVSTLMAHPQYDCVKPFLAWRIQTDLPSKRLKHCAIYKGRYDGQMVFRNGTSADYTPATRSIELPLIKDYFERGKMLAWRPTVDKLGYVYRLHAGLKQLCRSGKPGGDRLAERRWKFHNKDFGNEPLLPEEGLIQWSHNQLLSEVTKILQTIKASYREGKLRVPSTLLPEDEEPLRVMFEQLPWTEERLF